MSEQPPILTSFDGGVFTLTFNRPERLNAMSAALFDAAQAALDQAEASGARVLVMTGAGRAFNTGADLQESAARGASGDMGEALETLFNPFVERLAGLPMPVIAAVNGPCAGAGVGVALTADFVLMARSGYLLLAFVNIGLIPDAGVTYHLSRTIGRQRTTELMMLGERLPAEKAEAWGLAWRCVDDDALAAETATLAARLAGGPTQAYARMKRVLRETLATDLRGSLALERDGQRDMGRTSDFMEGVGAFLQKRPAAFQGR